MSGACRYCLRQAATCSGDAAFPFPRCRRCRAIHRATAVVTLLFKGAAVAASVIAASLSEPVRIALFTGLAILLVARVFMGLRLRLHAWVAVVDRLNALVRRRPTAYHARVWAHAPVTLRTVLDTAGFAALVTTVIAWPAARVVLFPSPLPGALTTGGRVDEPAVFALVAAVDDLAYWAPPEPSWGYGAGFVAVVGALWLAETIVGLALPRLLGTRPCGWPALD